MNIHSEPNKVNGKVVSFLNAVCLRDMIELYKVLAGKYDVAFSSNLVVLIDNKSDTMGHNLQIYKSAD